MPRARIRLAVVVATGLLLAGCGGADDPTDEDTGAAEPTGATETPTEEEATEEAADDSMDEDMDDSMDDDMDMDMSGAYGEPAEASEADRTIEVEVDNELAFKPDEFEVAAGEVVTFQITNSGDLEHEFVLGDEQAQQQMGEEMEEGEGHAHSGEMSNAVTIHPGESAELTWRFPEESTTVLIGCHVEGHYEGGMRGTVTVG